MWFFDDGVTGEVSCGCRVSPGGFICRRGAGKKPRPSKVLYHSVINLNMCKVMTGLFKVRCHKRNVILYH